MKFARRPKRLAPEKLLDAVAESAGVAGQSVALLVVQLGRSDRLDAVARTAESRAISDEVARRVEHLLQPHDVYAVCSCDELWIGLVRLSDHALSSVAAMSLRELLRMPYPSSVDVGDVQMQPTIGIVTGTGRFERPELLSAADAALQQARRSPDRIHCVPLAASQQAGSGDTIKSRVKDALLQNRLEVVAQPKIELAHNTCTGAELLIRWPGDDAHPVDPQTIASVCEEIGLADELALFVLNTAMRALTSVDAQHYVGQLSVNLSAHTFLDPQLPQLMQQLCCTWSIPASRFCLELTESTLIRSETSVVENMHALREVGCSLALDDFGTGFSSLAYLQKFPFDELKIDRAFVHDLESNPLNRKLVRAIAQMAHAFGFTSVAEGVENRQVATYLAQAGCQVGQGWLYGRPIPLDAFLLERAAEGAARPDSQPVRT